MFEVQNEIGEEAGPTTCDCGSMRPDPNENRIKRFVITITSRLLAAFLALSFLATLLPAGAVAAQSIMACCRGKSANHCHIGLKPAKTTSVGDNPCHSNCCVCCAPAQQTKREQLAVQTIVNLLSPRAVLKPSSSGVAVFLTDDEWTTISPRGPPAFLP